MTRRRWCGRAAILAAALVSALAPSVAAACGGFYAEEVEVDPNQVIVVTHREGLENYVFRPRFCGAAAEFGLILPIPAALAGPPALADAALFEELDRYTEPTLVEVCESSTPIGCGSVAGGKDEGPPGIGSGVDVIDRGTVGIFTWTLLQADTAARFTDWLAAKGYPDDPGGAAAYAYYVDAGWYFVAFEVTAGASAPPAGMKLCGDLGPIQVSFASPSPVIPARITSVNTAGAPPPLWRVAVLAPTAKAVAGSFRWERYFSGTLGQAQLADFPVLKAASLDGERLSVVDVTFPAGGATVDIELVDSLDPSDFRSERHVVKDCGACSAGGAPMGMAGAAAVLALARALRRGRRRRG